MSIRCGTRDCEGCILGEWLVAGEVDYRAVMIDECLAEFMQHLLAAEDWLYMSQAKIAGHAHR